MNEIKRRLFYEFLDLAGRVFIMVRYSEDVIIGNRGFTDEERENGIILVFNQKMNFLWDDYGINAKLVFGTTPQKCIIPADDIVTVYSPELKAQFTVIPDNQRESETKEGRDIQKTDNVIKIDFTKRFR